MATTYAKHVSTKKTPQTSPIIGKKMVKNNAGGYVFKLDKWKQLERFLILGNEGGSYYCSEKKMTVNNCKCLLKCAKEDPQRTVDLIVDISDNGRAPKNDPAIFALAVLAGEKGKVADLALAELNKVCRIGTHLFDFVQNVRQFRGMGDGLKNAIQKWYTDKDENSLAYQAVKYQQRNGMSHRDVLRLVRPRGMNTSLMRWMTKNDRNLREVRRLDPMNFKEVSISRYGAVEDNLPHIVEGFEKAKVATKASEIVNLISDYNLPRECIPTQFLNDVSVWESLLEKMPMTAMIRNLGKMSSVGLLKPMNRHSQAIAQRLTNQENLRKGRIHPIQILVAKSIYDAGHGLKGSLTWKVDSNISSALDDAFYLAFHNVVPTGKRFFLGVDVSGSMDWGYIAGTFLKPRVAAAAMAMLYVKTEPLTYTTAFSHQLVNVNLNRKMDLTSVVKTFSKIPMGGTNCALPMVAATQDKIETDVFVVITDNDTWSGKMHPCQALEQYRQKMGIPAKLVVMGLTSTGFTIADKDDKGGSLDVVGFDASVPGVVREFVNG